jgi:hypothetical protein
MHICDAGQRRRKPADDSKTIRKLPKTVIIFVPKFVEKLICLAYDKD